MWLSRWCTDSRAVKGSECATRRLTGRVELGQGDGAHLEQPPALLLRREAGRVDEGAHVGGVGCTLGERQAAACALRRRRTRAPPDGDAGVASVAQDLATAGGGPRSAGAGSAVRGPRRAAGCAPCGAVRSSRIARGACSAAGSGRPCVGGPRTASIRGSCAGPCSRCSTPRASSAGRAFTASGPPDSVPSACASPGCGPVSGARSVGRGRGCSGRGGCGLLRGGAALRPARQLRADRRVQPAEILRTRPAVSPASQSPWAFPG